MAFRSHKHKTFKKGTSGSGRGSGSISGFKRKTKKYQRKRYRGAGYKSKGGDGYENGNENIVQKQSQNQTQTEVALRNTGRAVAQTAVNVADKIATPVVEAMGVDLNQPLDVTIDRVLDPLEKGIDILKQPRVKRVIQKGLVELVDDLKPAAQKLADDSVSLVANVAEDIAGPLIGVPRTIGNAADIVETGIELADKTMGNISDISDAVADASKGAVGAVNAISSGDAVSSMSALNSLKKTQAQAFDKSQESMRALGSNVKSLKNMTGGRGRNKTLRKRSIFQELHAYF
jgi:hypothetical protein